MIQIKTDQGDYLINPAHITHVICRLSGDNPFLNVFLTGTGYEGKPNILHFDGDAVHQLYAEIMNKIR